MSTDNEFEVVALTRRRAVRIRRSQWPVIAKVSEHDGPGEDNSQARNVWTMTVREHWPDNMMLIEAKHTLRTPEGETHTEAALLIDSEVDDIAHVIADAALEIDRSKPEDQDVTLQLLRLVGNVIAALPPVELDLEPDVQSQAEREQAAAELLDAAFMGLHGIRGSGPVEANERRRMRSRISNMIEMMAVLTCRNADAIYEQFQDRLQDRVESALAAQE